MPKETIRFEPFISNRTHGRRGADDVEIDANMFGSRGMVAVRIRGNHNANLVLTAYDAKRLGVMLFGMAEELMKQTPPEPPELKAGDLVKVMSLDYYGNPTLLNGSYKDGAYKVSATKAGDPKKIRLIQHAGYRSDAHDRELVVFHERPGKKE